MALIVLKMTVGTVSPRLVALLMTTVPPLLSLSSEWFTWCVMCLLMAWFMVAELAKSIRVMWLLLMKCRVTLALVLPNRKKTLGKLLVWSVLP